MIGINDHVRVINAGGDTDGPGESVTDILKELETGRLYVVREIDDRPLAKYGHRLIRLHGVTNPTLNTMWGKIEIGYREDRFEKVEPQVHPGRIAYYDLAAAMRQTGLYYPRGADLEALLKQSYEMRRELNNAIMVAELAYFKHKDDPSWHVQYFPDDKNSGGPSVSPVSASGFSPASNSISGGGDVNAAAVSEA